MKEIVSTIDPLWDFWLSVYYRSFPEDERMTLGFLVSKLNEKDSCDPEKTSTFGVYEAGGEPTGIVYYAPRLENRLVELWYLAVAPERRGNGAGSALFSEVVQAATRLNADLLVWEVECSDPKDPIPDRRIEWYQGLGAKKVEGIRYHQSVDRPLPSVPMSLMVYFLSKFEVDAPTVFRRLKANYAGNLEQEGVLRLV